jgi:hypothetical protein
VAHCHVRLRAWAQDDPAQADREGAQRQRPNIVIDGGGKITLSGAGTRRILYMNTCDPKLGI